MGFRCPACRQDFGTNKVAMAEHLNLCAVGKSFVAGTLRVTEDEREQKAFGVAADVPVPELSKGFDKAWRRPDGSVYYVDSSD